MDVDVRPRRVVRLAPRMDVKMDVIAFVMAVRMGVKPLPEQAPKPPQTERNEGRSHQALSPA